MRNKLQWNLSLNSYIFIQGNAFQNVLWNMATILSWPECINDERRAKIRIWSHKIHTMCASCGVYIRSMLQKIYHAVKNILYCIFTLPIVSLTTIFLATQHITDHKSFTGCSKLICHCHKHIIIPTHLDLYWGSLSSVFFYARMRLIGLYGLLQTYNLVNSVLSPLVLNMTSWLLYDKRYDRNQLFIP